MTPRHSIAADDVSRRITESLGFVVGVCICAAIALGLIVRAGGRHPAGPPIPLDETLNPNRDPAASLTRLPGVGLSRARAIVAYRQRYQQIQGGRPAFSGPDDLQNIRGIGPKIASGMTPWLQFNDPCNVDGDPDGESP